MTTLLNANGEARETNGRMKLDPTVALQILAWIIAAVFTYGAISSRVAVVESRQGDSERRMERIESKVDRLLELAR